MSREGVGKPRIISGNTYYPIYYRYEGKQVINTSVKAASISEAHKQLSQRIADFHAKPKAPSISETDYDIIREALRKDIASDSEVEKTINRYVLIFDRVFIDFRQKHYPELTGCSKLPIGFFRKYKAEFAGNWRAEVIFIKAIMARLVELGYSTEDDLKQVRSIPTPEGEPKLPPKVTNKQLHDLLSFIKKDRPDFYKPIMFMCFVGRRVSETCAIMREDVLLDGLKPILIQTKPKTAKTKKTIPPPLHLEDPELNSFIRTCLANTKTPWLFPYKKGGKIPSNYLWKYLTKVSIERIGVRIKPHDLRKLFLTKANIGGLDKNSMAMANIKNVSVMMKHYVDTTPEGQAKVLEKIRGGAYNEKA